MKMKNAHWDELEGMNSRCYPRTMQEAFGPYTDNFIDEPIEDGAARALVTVVAVTLILIWLN